MITGLRSMVLIALVLYADLGRGAFGSAHRHEPYPQE